MKSWEMRKNEKVNREIVKMIEMSEMKIVKRKRVGSWLKWERCPTYVVNQTTFCLKIFQGLSTTSLSGPLSILQTPVACQHWRNLVKTSIRTRWKGWSKKEEFLTSVVPSKLKCGYISDSHPEDNNFNPLCYS